MGHPRKAPEILAVVALAVGTNTLCATAQDGIVVTAERRAQSLLDVPQSITALSGEDLQRINADHIAEALSRAPGVSLHRGSGAEHLTAIRSPVLTSGAGAGSFLFLENGVPIRSAGFANINGLFDSHFEIADRIEIIRGPSGALYGANAIHGVINVFTPEPSENFTASAEIFGDTVERFKAKATLSGSEGAHGFFIGASATTEAGYRANAGLDQQKLTARHIYHANDISIDTVFSFDNLEQETAGFIFGVDVLNDRDLRRTNDFPGAYRDAKSARLQSTIEFAAGENTQVSITPYARWNEMVFPQHFLPSNALEENGHWSVGMQSALYRDAGAFSFIAGVDAEYTDSYLREFQADPTIFSYTQGLHYDYEVAAIMLSGFAKTDYVLGPRTTASVALRVDGVFYEYDNLTDSGIVGRFLRLSDRDDSFVTTSPKLVLRHEVSDQTIIYASYARGARPPQTTDLYRLQINQTGDQAQPEKIDAGEIGLRTALGDKVDISLSGFFMDKRNFFFRDADGFNVADGKTRHVGVEADIRIELDESLMLSSAFTYARHTYRFDRMVGNASETVTFGDDVDTAPRVIANTRLLWRPAESYSFEAEWVFMGSYFTDAANDHKYDGHSVINLRAEAKLTSELAAFVTVRNVADELHAERADYAFGEDRYFPAEERTFGFGLRYVR